MVSIIVPVYNAEKFICLTLDNLLKQSVDKEIILVNDGSTDESLKIIKQYATHHACIRIIDQPNSGVSAARNAGIEAAKGDFIMFVDADDLLDDGALAKVMNSFNDTIDGVFYTYKHVAANGNIIKVISYLPTGTYTVPDWTNETMRFIHTFIIGCVGAYVIRKDILTTHSIRFNEKMSHYEDIAFGFQILEVINKLYFINQPFYWYMHQNPNSLFGRYPKNLPYSAEICLDQIMKVFDISKCKSYIIEVLRYCIRNESEYFNIKVQDRVKNLSILSQSKYLPYLDSTFEDKINSYFLKNKLFKSLLLYNGITPWIRFYFWGKMIVPCGRLFKQIIKLVSLSFHNYHTKINGKSKMD